MKHSIRLALLVCASFVGLAFAGPALADYQPSLTVEQSSYKLGAPFTADLFVAASPTEDPSAKLTIFSPAGYTVNLAKAPGTPLGKAIAVIQVAGAANVPVAGRVVVADPTDPTIMATSTKCTGAPTNQAVLAVNLTIQGQSLSIPVFANKVGPFATFQVCVPHPSVAPLGARILLLDATIAGVFRNPSSLSPNGYEWSGLFTPYDATTKLPNPAATIEWRTFVPLGAKLTLAKAKAKAKKGFKLVGRLSIPGVDLGQSTVRLNLYAGKKRTPAPNATSAGTGKRVARSAKLPRTGKYSMTRRSVKFTTFFQTRFEGYGTKCDSPSPTGQKFPCKGEDIAAITSNQVKVLKPKKKTKRR